MKPAKHIVFGPHDAAKREKARQLRLINPTEAEKALWSRLNKNQVAGLPFRRQQVIEGFIVDFYCHRVRLAVEVDGEVHDRQREYDAERDAALNAVGVRVLRFTNEQVRDHADEVVGRIAQAARQAGPPPGVR
jgi:very-short-patch-repair endonuclease